MSRTKFGAGQRVSILRSGASLAPLGSYIIVNALPRERGPQQYRVKNETENFDRVLDESRLEAMVHE